MASALLIISSFSGTISGSLISSAESIASSTSCLTLTSSDILASICSILGEDLDFLLVL